MTRTDWLESLGPGDTVVLVFPHLRSALDPKSGLLPVQICVVDIDKIVLGATGMERAWIVWRDGGFYNHDSQCWYIAIGQGSAACGASPAPTGCAANGTNNERTEK